MPNQQLFKISKPYGYYMPEVNKAIEQYNIVCEELKQTIINQNIKLAQNKKELKTVRDELKNMQLEISMLDVPDMGEVEEHFLLNEFKDKTCIHNNNYQENNKKETQHKSKKKIDVYKENNIGKNNPEENTVKDNMIEDDKEDNMIQANNEDNIYEIVE